MLVACGTLGTSLIILLLTCPLVVGTDQECQQWPDVEEHVQSEGFGSG